MNNRFLVVLWGTERCNLSCKYCYAEAGDGGRSMKPETAFAVLDRLRENPLKIQFAGGEPLLNMPFIEQVCGYVRQNGIDAVFQLQTNGTLITPAVAARLRRLGISVGVSLDGPPAVNELTRGRTDLAVNGIRALGEENITVGINCVVTALNADSLPQLVDFAFYLGNVGGIGLDLLRKAGRGKNVSPASPAQLENALTAMHKRSEQLFALSGRRVAIREIELAKKRLAENKPSADYCYASCGRSAVVLPDGRIYPCGSLISEEYSGGNARYFSAGKLPRLKSCAYEKCGGCRFKGICPKGCPSRIIRNGENDLDCVLQRRSFEIAEKLI